MKLINYIKQKIARRKERKAIMDRLSFKNGKIYIDADVIISGNIIGCCKFPQEKYHRDVWNQKFDGTIHLKPTNK